MAMITRFGGCLGDIEFLNHAASAGNQWYHHRRICIFDGRAWHGLTHDLQELLEVVFSLAELTHLVLQ